MATKNTALRNQMADDFGALWNSGTLVIKDSGGTILVTFDLAATAFGSAAVGTISATATPLTASAAATGTADNAELVSVGDTHTIIGLTVALTAAQVNLDNLSINVGQTVNLTSFSWTESASV